MPFCLLEASDSRGYEAKYLGPFFLKSFEGIPSIVLNFVWTKQS